MIKQAITLYKETYTHTTAPKTHSVPRVFPTNVHDSKAARVMNGQIQPKEDEYAEYLKIWNTKNITAVGQALYVKFGPTSTPQRRIFAGILPPQKSHVQNYGQAKEVQMIEVWNPENNYFTRVCPTCCSLLNT